ncbi:MAG: biotin transporter BioY [Erysipelotrichaceae bacterium]|nr:biotin transporter BioY [Erysipelotrichaceae bacterium]
MKTKEIATIGIFTALMAVISPIAIPLSGGVDISLATLMVMLIGCLFSPRDSLIIVSLYIVLAFIGLPVLAGFTGGAGILFGKTGGYVLGYLVLVYCVSKAAKTDNKPLIFISMLIGNLLLYTLGTAWFMYVTGINLMMSLTYCVFPFLFTDFLKCLIVFVIFPKLKKVFVKK